MKLLINLTDYINQNVTEINGASLDKIDFSPKSNHHHWYMLLQNNEPIGKFIDEIIEGKETNLEFAFYNSTRT